MTEHEIKIIDGQIEAYKNMIKYFEQQICVLLNKKRQPCCFQDESKIKLKIKCGECHD